MSKFIKYRTMIILFVIFFLGTCYLPLSLPKTIGHNYEQTARSISGQILFAPMDSYITYLIDNIGTVNHTWSSNYFPGEAVYWLNDGTILRTIKIAPSGNGAGGGIQKVTWDGTILWEYIYYTSEVLSHHDIEPLPNGNILMIAWETKTRDQAIAAGRDPNQVYSLVRPDHVIEVKPTGPTSGEIVWEWHVWDHLIQDYDPLKANYGVVSNHPELIDINFGGSQIDWLHCNSIDYNVDFDQILISCLKFKEIWVIDHSTTTEEAAGHTGGNSGKGGDLLYRWGNPRAYDRGTTSDQKLFDQHCTVWIGSGCPGEGNILIFNNGFNRPAGMYSSVDEIVPPVDNNGTYYLASGDPFGPDSPIWCYTANPPTSFYAGYLSGCERLPNGNTLICDGPAGRFFEVTSDMVTVWEYVNPYPNPLFNNVFKIEYIPPPEPPEPKVPDLDCEGSISWKDIKPGSTLTGSFEVRNIGDINSFLNWTIDSFPSWGNWSFTPNSGVYLTPDDGPVTVQITFTAPDTENAEFEGYIRVVNQDNPYDFDVIPVYLETPSNRVLIYFVDEFLSNHPYLFPILRYILGL